jgi:hypothetical protein
MFVHVCGIASTRKFGIFFFLTKKLLHLFDPVGIALGVVNSAKEDDRNFTIPIPKVQT